MEQAATAVDRRRAIYSAIMAEQSGTLKIYTGSRGEHMSAIVPKVGNAAVVEVDTDQVDLAGAVAQLQHAVAGAFDDVQFEFYQEKTAADVRGRTHLRFRAYRRAT
jgi:hypothetical protein